MELQLDKPQASLYWTSHKRPSARHDARAVMHGGLVPGQCRVNYPCRPVLTRIYSSCVMRVT